MGSLLHKTWALKGWLKAGMALMFLHVFFNIVTLVGTPPKSAASPGNNMPKFSCDTPAAPPVQLELFSALGMSPGSNPFSGKVTQPTPSCPPAAPRPLT